MNYSLDQMKIIIILLKPNRPFGEFALMDLYTNKQNTYRILATLLSIFQLHMSA